MPNTYTTAAGQLRYSRDGTKVQPEPPMLRREQAFPWLLAALNAGLLLGIFMKRMVR
ncbi:MAG: hypothetical protein SFX18_11010 [Pirellulales bacterium]|nr:hypothetical protein [Pirellulales bacterium]